MVLSQKLYGILHELPSPVRVSEHRRKSAGTFVPTSDGQQGFQVLVVRFQAVELGVSTCKNRPRLIHANLFFPLHHPALPRTFLDILVLVERFQSVVLGESAERVDQVSA